MPAQRRGLIIACLSLALMACQEDGPRASSETSDVPDPLAEFRESCERTGGRWGNSSGDVLFTCFRDTRDANQQCRADSDCEDVCLARSRTCAPVTPFLGCHQVLTDGGQVATQCTN